MSSTLNWIGNYLHIIHEGEITINDLIESQEKMIGDPRFDLIEYCISDYLKVTKVHISKEDMIIISTLNKSSLRWNKKLKLSVVYNNKKFDKLVSIYIDLTEHSGWEIKLFNNLEESLKWCKQ